MADENAIVCAKNIYSDLCATLDKRNWHYQKHDNDLVITFGITGEDIPMEFVLAVDVDRQLLRVFSKLPFSVPEDKRMELAIASCVASNGLADGCFNYDIVKGTIVFRLTASFRESKLGENLFNYLIDCSCITVDRYNDKFLALCKGLISINDFISQE